MDKVKGLESYVKDTEKLEFNPIRVDEIDTKYLCIYHPIGRPDITVYKGIKEYIREWILEDVEKYHDKVVIETNLIINNMMKESE